MDLGHTPSWLGEHCKPNQSTQTGRVTRLGEYNMAGWYEWWVRVNDMKVLATLNTCCALGWPDLTYTDSRYTFKIDVNKKDTAMTIASSNPHHLLEIPSSRRRFCSSCIITSVNVNRITDDLHTVVGSSSRHAMSMSMPPSHLPTDELIDWLPLNWEVRKQVLLERFAGKMSTAIVLSAHRSAPQPVWGHTFSRQWWCQCVCIMTSRWQRWAILTTGLTQETTHSSHAQLNQTHPLLKTVTMIFSDRYNSKWWRHQSPRGWHESSIGRALRIYESHPVLQYQHVRPAHAIR